MSQAQSALVSKIILEGKRRRHMMTHPAITTVTIQTEDGDQTVLRVPFSCGLKIKHIVASSVGGPLHEVLTYIEDLLREDAQQRCYDLLGRREHSVFELREKLERYPYDESLIDEVVQVCIDQRYLDDQRFADLFIRSKMNVGWGQRRIEHELRLRGVDCHDVPGYPGEYFDNESDLERARHALARRRVPEHHPYQKLFRYLYDRGYDAEIARQAVTERLEDPED